VVFGIAVVVVMAMSVENGAIWNGLLRSVQTPVRTAPSKALPIPIDIKPGPVVSVTRPRPEGTDSSVSPVPQELKLVSTDVGRNATEGIAHLGVSVASPQTYRAGAILANGARLTEVFDHYVVLERGGHHVRLFVNNQPGTNFEDADRQLLSVGGTAVSGLSATAMTAETANKQDLRAPDVRSAMPLSEYLRPTAVYSGDRLRGYLLTPGSESRVFDSWGLLPGDLLVQIDGHALGTSEQNIRALETLADGAALSATIEREGARFTVALDGAALRSPPMSKVTETLGLNPPTE
jgi:type II secretion system protein C